VQTSPAAQFAAATHDNTTASTPLNTQPARGTGVELSHRGAVRADAKALLAAATSTLPPCANPVPAGHGKEHVHASTMTSPALRVGSVGAANDAAPFTTPPPPAPALASSAMLPTGTAPASAETVGLTSELERLRSYVSLLESALEARVATPAPVNKPAPFQPAAVSSVSTNATHATAHAVVLSARGRSAGPVISAAKAASAATAHSSHIAQQHQHQRVGRLELSTATVVGDACTPSAPDVRGSDRWRDHNDPPASALALPPTPATPRPASASVPAPAPAAVRGGGMRVVRSVVVTGSGGVEVVYGSATPEGGGGGGGRVEWAVLPPASAVTGGRAVARVGR